jgi:hypothetical protein
MEDNKVILALENAKAFLNKVLAEDNAVVDFLARTDVKLTLSLLEGKFPVVKNAVAHVDTLSGYVNNIAKNALAVINDIEEIIKIVSNPLA